MAVFICTLIFKISRMHTCIPVVCVYIYMWGGGGRGVGLGRCCYEGGCKQEIDVQLCTCVLIAVFLICV